MNDEKSMLNHNLKYMGCWEKSKSIHLSCVLVLSHLKHWVGSKFSFPSHRLCLPLNSACCDWTTKETWASTFIAPPRVWGVRCPSGNTHQKHTELTDKRKPRTNNSAKTHIRNWWSKMSILAKQRKCASISCTQNKDEWTVPFSVYRGCLYLLFWA